jgi:AcrR family transcriptional regulator
VPLAKSLGVTTGSFYWHFKDRRDLLDSLLDYWDKEMTQSVIEHVDDVQHMDPVARILELMEFIVSHEMARHDPAIRAWALFDKSAARKVRQVDRKRLGYVKALFVEAGFSARQADARSRMLATFLSAEHTVLLTEPPAKRKRLLRLRHEILTS